MPDQYLPPQKFPQDGISQREHEIHQKETVDFLANEGFPALEGRQESECGRLAAPAWFTPATMSYTQKSRPFLCRKTVRVYFPFVLSSPLSLPSTGIQTPTILPSSPPVIPFLRANQLPFFLPRLRQGLSM